MKKYLITSLVFLFGFFSLTLSPTQAQIDSMISDEHSNEAVDEDNGHGESIEVVLSEMLTKQQADSIQKLNCDQISDDELERMGDAVMEQQHPGDAHQAMDQMMGGEGSESLRLMHTNMGSAYLGCSENLGSGIMGSGMMGMIGAGMMGSGSMMGAGNRIAGAYGVLGSLTWISLIVFLLAGVYFFLKQANKK